MLGFKKHIALLAGILLTVATAHAQDWNRGIRDVRIVHPPGTPPGTWRVSFDYGIMVTDNAPTPASLSAEATIALNGVPIEVLPLLLFRGNGGSGCSGCPINQPCTQFPVNGIAYGGACGYSQLQPFWPCGCYAWLREDGGNFNTDLRQTDVISVTLTTTPASLPETYTADDSDSTDVASNPIGTPTCFGDGSSPVPCPCANSGASGHGCANSTNPSGALLDATGFSQPDLLTGLDSVVLHGSGMPSTSTAIYLKGDASTGPAGFGDGLLCTGGSLIRLRTKINVGGASRFPEPGDPSLAVRGGTPPGSGLTGHYQVYYRNAAAAFCPPATFNVSNGHSITW